MRNSGILKYTVWNARIIYPVETMCFHQRDARMMCNKSAASPSRTPKTEILPNSKCRRERERFSEREFRGVGLVKEGWTKVNRSDRQERNGNKREERVASLFKETAVKKFWGGGWEKKKKE
ncbi:hypothetical protein CEXT_696941 [Caerostris extrusa]|uniref:Uncharacterized protein n=1 Tax=Caerostris extrusa TaxID=172846 RepID=A0AAV4SAC0_CAEEX|nr:hypothetical protein CEXT_696941 [Caerostris extrusa]